MIFRNDLATTINEVENLLKSALNAFIENEIWVFISQYSSVAAGQAYRMESCVPRLAYVYTL